MSIPEAQARTPLRPFWGRVSVLPSPVDEEQRESGLVVPLRYEGDQNVARGIVEAVDETGSHPDLVNAYEVIRPGTVVYYRDDDKLPRIRGLVLLAIGEILAYEP